MRGEGWKAAFSTGRVIGISLMFLTAGAAIARATDEATNEEYALLVLANEARSDPSAFGFDDPVVPPMRWSAELASAARAHSSDMAANGCYQHDSCNGQTWWKRVERYYPGWTGLAENIIAIGDTPQQMHDGWMNSRGHRENILSGGLVDFGAGIAVGEGHFGPIAFGTEDFGVRALPSLRSLPAIPAAAALPRTGSDRKRLLVANFYDYDGPPRSVHALVDGSCVELTLRTGRAAHGTYAVLHDFPGSKCVSVVFEAVAGDGVRFRFPADGAILVAAGGAMCAQRTPTPPTQSCGGGPVPTPTPAPNPGPTATPTASVPGDIGLSRMRVVLAPGTKDASKGQVTLVATLPQLPSFDPTAASIELVVGLPSGDWTRTLPALCNGSPCVTRAKRGNAYHAKYGNTARLSFTRGKGGRWTLRYSSRRESLGPVTPGPVTLRIALGELDLSTSGQGRLQENRLIAE